MEERMPEQRGTGGREGMEETARALVSRITTSRSITTPRFSALRTLAKAPSVRVGAVPLDLKFAFSETSRAVVHRGLVAKQQNQRCGTASILTTTDLGSSTALQGPRLQGLVLPSVATLIPSGAALHGVVFCLAWHSAAPFSLSASTLPLLPPLSRRLRTDLRSIYCVPFFSRVWQPLEPDALQLTLLLPLPGEL
ncbi:hypothetical protein BHE74_00058313 [Ensete ventricosum]|nr:hypothetical protein BHE74_00058313 [Ensete ventricosum]